LLLTLDGRSLEYPTRSLSEQRSLTIDQIMSVGACCDDHVTTYHQIQV